MNAASSDAALAARGAFAGATLFVLLIIGFSALGGAAPSPPLMLFMGVVGAGSHLVLLPVVATLPAPAWTRVGGYAWIAIDVMLNVATVNGAERGIVAALRLGGHVPAALWMGAAAYRACGAVRLVGVPLAAVLLTHAFVSPWMPAWIIFIPFMAIPVWLALVGRHLQRDAMVLPAPSPV